MKIAIALFLVALLMPIAMAKEASAGVLPDSPLYGLDKAMERISLAMSLGHAGKAEKRLQRASERIAELAAMVDKGKPEYNSQLLGEQRNELDSAQDEALIEKDAGKDTAELEKKIADATYKHVVVLESVLARAPASAQSGLTNAIQMSTKDNQRALTRLEKQTGIAADANIDLVARRRGR